MARKGTGPDTPETEKKAEPTKEATAETPEVETGAPDETVKAPEASKETEVEAPEVPAETEPEAQPEAGRGMAKKADPKIQEKPKKEMATIIIAETRTDAEQQDVFVTDPSDGTPFQIQRGKQVDVPIGVLNNLRESVQEKLVRNEGKESWKKVPRFSFQVIKEYTK